MSKKQRERVEDEANFHKRRLSQLIDGSLTVESVDEKATGLMNNNEGELFQRFVMRPLVFKDINCSKGL